MVVTIVVLISRMAMLRARWKLQQRSVGLQNGGLEHFQAPMQPFLLWVGHVNSGRLCS